MDTIEYLVIGAGVVGLAVAAKLAECGKEVLVVEAEDAIGTQTSARNSEVIHAGIYYPENSLKAALCMPGRDALYKYCNERGVPYKQCGKLIVAPSSANIDDLNAILVTGEKNGVSDLEYLSREATTERAPALNVSAAIWSPTTGIIDSHQLMLALLGDVENNGGMLALRSKVINVIPGNDGFGNDGYIVTVENDGQTIIFARSIVNCAGLGATAVANNIQGLPLSTIPSVTYAKGSYFSYAAPVPFDCLIYPMPAPGGLGIHLTLDQAGQARFGPDVEWVNDVDYSVDPNMAGKFTKAISSYWPEIDASKLQASYSGIRIKTFAYGNDFHDFIISGPKQHGLIGLVNLFGIESPGLTSCLAIADYVARTLEEASG